MEPLRKVFFYMQITMKSKLEFHNMCKVAKLVGDLRNFYYKIMFLENFVPENGGGVFEKNTIKWGSWKFSTHHVKVKINVLYIYTPQSNILYSVYTL